MPYHIQVTNKSTSIMSQATLFQTGNDLSDDFMKVCYRRMKTNSFDIYQMIGNPNVSIKHRTRRGPSEFVGYSENGNANYIAGIAFDSFDVWVQNGNGSSCVCENASTFEDAIAVALKHI